MFCSTRSLIYKKLNFYLIKTCLLVVFMDTSCFEYNTEDTHNDGHTLRHNGHRYSRMRDEHVQSIIHRQPTWENVATTIDMKLMDKHPEFMKGKHIPFYLIEDQLVSRAVRTAVKQGYTGKISEYWLPATYINAPSQQFSKRTNMSAEAPVEDIEYDPTQIYQVTNDVICNTHHTMPVFHKLRSLSQEPRTFDDGTKQLAYGVINPETKHTTLFYGKHIVHGANDVITFDFGDYVTISHIETFGRYPKHVSYKEFSKVSPDNIRHTSTKLFNNVRVCLSNDPQQYVKKFEVKYRDKTGKWISIGIHMGNHNISCGKLNRVDVYTRYLRIIPIDFRGVDPSMEIMIYGPGSHLADPQYAKSPSTLVKYIVKEKCPRYIPDGCIHNYRPCEGCRAHRFPIKKHNTKEYLRYEND